MTDIEQLIKKGKSFIKNLDTIEDELIHDLTMALAQVHTENIQLRTELDIMTQKLNAGEDALRRK